VLLASRFSGQCESWVFCWLHGQIGALDRMIGVEERFLEAVLSREIPVRVHE
jgi:hypothetical protein